MGRARMSAQAGMQATALRTPRKRTASSRRTVFEALVPPLVRSRLLGDASPAMAPSAQRLPAAVMFADLSGFSALAEELAPRSRRGAQEDLRDLLDLVFGRMVALVDRHGGQVLSFRRRSGGALAHRRHRRRRSPARGHVRAGHSARTRRAAGRNRAAAADARRHRIGRAVGRQRRRCLGAMAHGRRRRGAAPGDSQRRRCESGEVVVSGRVWELVQRDAEGWALPSSGACVRAVTPAATPPR